MRPVLRPAGALQASQPSESAIHGTRLTCLSVGGGRQQAEPRQPFGRGTNNSLGKRCWEEEFWPDFDSPSGLRSRPPPR